MALFGRPSKTEKLVAQIVAELNKSMAVTPYGSSGYNRATPAEPWQGSGGQGIFQVAGEIEPLARPGMGPNGFGAMMGPAAPLLPALIDDPLDTGRAMPRRYQFSVAENLNLSQTEVPFEILKSLSEQCDIIHRCIEIRVSEIQKMGWSFGPSERAITAIMEDQDCSHAKAARIFREQYGEDMKRLSEFWENPYVHQFRGWTEWISEYLWQSFTYDGVPVYPRWNLGGDTVLGFDIIDSPTIKVLLNNRGDLPYPPDPSYQQILWGFPRGEFVASDPSEVDGEFVDAMKGRVARSDGLAYFVRNRRVHSPYGYSSVEAAIPAATLYLDRQTWMRAEYQQGATPLTWMRTNSVELDHQKLSQFERILNDKLMGSTAERHRVKVLPDGFDPVAMPSIDEKYKEAYDEFVIKRIASIFGVSPTQLGVIPRQGLGGKGQQDGEAEQAETVSSRPMANHVVEVINSLSRRFLGSDKNITFQLADTDSSKDEEAKAKAFQISLYSGAMTLNDVRGSLGMPLYDMNEADEPMIVAGNTVQFLKGMLETDGSGETVGQTDGHLQPGEAEEGEESPQGQGQEGAQPEGEAPRDEAGPVQVGLKTAEAELQAFHKFASARIKKGVARDFLFRTIDEEDAWALNQDVQAIIKGETYTPPKGVQEAAQRALEWIKDDKAGSGFTAVGRKRASDLARGAGVSMATLRRMKAYFDRHQGDKDATGFKAGEDGYPSPGRVAWDAWGGDAGYSWVKGLVGEEKGATPGDTPKGVGLTKRSKEELPGYKAKTDLEAKHRQAVRDAIVLNGVGTAIRQAVERTGLSKDKAIVTATVEQAVAQHVEAPTGRLVQTLTTIYGDAGLAGRTAGSDAVRIPLPNPGPKLTALLDNVDTTAGEIAGTTLSRVRDIIANGILDGESTSDISQQVADLIGDWQRADMIAETEIAAAYNSALLDTYQEAGLSGWYWLAYDGACEECQSQAGFHDMSDTDIPPDASHPFCRCQPSDTP